jgi:hypothetical protein
LRFFCGKSVEAARLQLQNVKILGNVTGCAGIYDGLSLCKSLIINILDGVTAQKGAEDEG